MSVQFKKTEILDLDAMKIRLHRIIPFSNVEGSGNRTSVFLQGCNINCLYCHNPETIASQDKDAKIVSFSYILNEIKKAMPFIRGVTFSGGEPTIHGNRLVPLFRAIHELGLTVYLDSNGFFNFDAIFPLIKETDKFLFDIKGDSLGLAKLCFDLKNMKADEKDISPNLPELALDNFVNLKKLLALDKVEEVRLVHIKNYYDPYETVNKIASCLSDYPEVLFKLIRVHGKGARNEKLILKSMPSPKEHEQLATYAKKQGIQKIQVIY